MNELTHFNPDGRARMVDVTEKNETDRVAEAAGRIVMAPETLDRIAKGTIGKGDVLAVAQVAGIMAAKKNLGVDSDVSSVAVDRIDISFALNSKAAAVEIRAIVKTPGRTGGDMEALTAVAAAALTIYDMCKAIDRGMCVENIRLLRKAGGRSGVFEREGE